MRLRYSGFGKILTRTGRRFQRQLNRSFSTQCRDFVFVLSDVYALPKRKNQAALKDGPYITRIVGGLCCGTGKSACAFCFVWKVAMHSPKKNRAALKDGP